MEEIKKESQHNKSNRNIQGKASNNFVSLENENRSVKPDGANINEQQQSTFATRIKKSAGIFMLAAILGMFFYAMGSTSTTVDTSEDAVAALESHMSVTLEAGTRLLEEDERYIGGDLTVTHKSKEDETTIYVWDYAAEDGDYVQILVDGTALGEPFMITNKPVTFTVPTVGEVQVKGTRDGGGGITYGVYYEVNHTTYFNGMDVGGDNVYTLVRDMKNQ